MASIKKQVNGRWQARFRDSTGREHAQRFERKVDAQRWLDEATAGLVTGQYVDPKAGTVTFREYAEQWREIQVHRPSSRAHVETMLRRHAYPTLGNRPMSSILPSDVQAWVRRLEAGGVDRKPLAPATIGVVHSLVAGVFKSAVRDRRIVSNPSEGTKLPRVERQKVVPPTTEQVEVLRDAMPEVLRALVTFAAGTGLRQGEVFGLTVDRLDMLRREVHVDRQLVGLDGLGAEVRATEDGRERAHRPAASGRRRLSGRALGRVPGRGRARVHPRWSRGHPATVRPPVAACSGLSGPSCPIRPARLAALLRESPDPSRREREDGPGAARTCLRGRDAGHLQPHVARLGRPHARGCRLRTSRNTP
jgi:integrase